VKFHVVSLMLQLTYLYEYYLPTYLPNSMEKLTVTQLVTKSPPFHVTRKFITVFTRTRQTLVSRARCIQSTLSHTISPRYILMLSSHLRLGHVSGLFPSGFLTKLCYTFLMSPMCAYVCQRSCFKLPNILLLIVYQ